MPKDTANPYNKNITAGLIATKLTLLNPRPPSHIGLRIIQRSCMQSINPISRNQRNLETIYKTIISKIFQ